MSMPALHIRDVPEEAVAALKKRAALKGQSLQTYLRNLIIDSSEQLTWDEFFEQTEYIRARSRVTPDDIVAAINAERREAGYE